MTPRLLLVILVVGLGSAWATSSEPKTTTRRAEQRITQLVADLASEDYATREAAMRQLEALGSAAREGLAQATLSADAEVRRRARELAEKLARSRETSAVLEPRRLRLVYRNVPVCAAVADLIRASSCRLAIDPPVLDRLTEQRITLDTGYTTFWDAFEQFCRAAGLAEKGPGNLAGENQTSNSSRYMHRRAFLWLWAQQKAMASQSSLSTVELKLTEGKPAALPTCHVGALRIRVLPAGVPLGNWTLTRGDQEVLLGLEVMAEPNLIWQGVQSLRVERAVDDKGQALAQPHAFLNSGPAANDGGQWDQSGTDTPGCSGQLVPLRLRVGRRPATLLREVQGTLTVRLLTSPQPVAAIDNVLRPPPLESRTGDGAVLKITEVQQLAGRRWQIRVRVEIPQPDDNNGFIVWGPQQRFQWESWNSQGENGPGSGGPLLLFDANGHLVRMTGAENLVDGNGESEGYRLTFQLAPGQAEPMKLVLQGRRSVLLDVPFRFHDVPLR